MLDLVVVYFCLSFLIIIIYAAKKAKSETPDDDALSVDSEPSDYELSDNEQDDDNGHIVKCDGSERPSGTFRGIIPSPTCRYGIMSQFSEGKPVPFPLFVVDVCRNTYSKYTSDESDERIKQPRNCKFLWLSDEMIVIMQYKDDRLMRCIYELDHEKKTVSFVYTGEDTCNFPVQVTDGRPMISFYLPTIRNGKYLMIAGTDGYFQLFHQDPRVPPKFTHRFFVDLREIRAQLMLHSAEDALLTDALCSGSKIRFEMLKRRDGQNADGSDLWAPNQLITFDLERVVEKQPDALTDTVTIGAGDEDCWSLATLELVDPEIVLKAPSSTLTSSSHSIQTYGKPKANKARTHFYAKVDMIIIDFNTMKCTRKKFRTKLQKLVPKAERNVNLYTHLEPFLRIEEWIWDEVRGAPCWSTLKSFPPTVVPSLEDLCRDAVLRNREKFSEDLPDYANILFPM